MDASAFFFLASNEAEKVALWGRLAKRPLQDLGSKITGGRFDVSDDVLRQRIADRYSDEPFVRRMVGRLIERQMIPAERITSDANLAVGTGAVGAGVGAVALARKVLKNRAARQAASNRGVGGFLKDHSLGLGVGGGFVAGQAVGKSMAERG